MDYTQALAYIHKTPRFGKKPGLVTITELLRRMGNPHKNLKFVHIAGTNGKGSTTAMVANILKSAGYKTGMYISPYIVRFNERMQINDEYILDGELARITAYVQKIVTSIMDDGFCQPTEFEIITATAMQFFYENKCDFVVLEVGLGGRFDSTNVIDCPLVAAICSISFDHTQILGDSIEQICREKCGIIKTGGVAVSYPDQTNQVVQIISNECERADATLFAAPDLSPGAQTSISGTQFFHSTYGKLEVPLVGIHQVHNASTAISIIEALKSEHSVEIPNSAIASGLKTVFFPGRFEVVAHDPTIVLDGAHNEAGAIVLSKVISAVAGNKKVVVVMGLLEDKKNCVEHIASIAHEFVATKPDNARSLDADMLANMARQFCSNVTVQPNVQRALEDAQRLCGKDDIICVCGSLYLVSEVRGILSNRILATLA